MQQVDLSQSPELMCEKCQWKNFEVVYCIRRIGEGTDQIVPIPIFRCGECGYVNEEFQLTDEKLKSINLSGPGSK